MNRIGVSYLFQFIQVQFSKNCRVNILSIELYCMVA